MEDYLAHRETRHWRDGAGTVPMLRRAPLPWLLCCTRSLAQAAEILLRLGEHTSGAGTEMWREACDGGNEAIGQMVERFRWRAGVGRAVFALRARFVAPAGLLGC